MKKRMNKKVAGVIAVAALSASMVIGGTLAYLTDNDSATNTFTYGDKVDIVGEEPGWVEDNAEFIEPTETVTEDPQIKNDGDNDVYAFIEVAVPVVDAIYADKDGVRQNNGNAAHIELFEFNATGKTCETATAGIGKSDHNDAAADGWTLMYQKEMDVDMDGDGAGAAVPCMVYTYSLNKILAVGETSSKLFNTITMANVVEGQGISDELNVELKFYGIQTVNTGDKATGVPAQAKAAYDKYVNQNAGLAGAVINDVTP